MKSRKLSHIQIIALGYLIMIIIGTLLLMLPISSRSGSVTNPLTALFTATSASCVTGLILHDTATYWSLFGQIVIISLIQIGGLGFMTIATFFYKLIKRRTSLRERAVMAESINTTRMSGFLPLTKKIIAGTVIFEASGAMLLSIRLIPKFGFLKGIYMGIFHAVSAFCNAGFDLFGTAKPSSSLTTVSGDVVINAVIMLLIVIGGIGFLVWDDMIACRFRFRRFSLHTKLVLFMTCILIFGGALLLYIFEFGSWAPGTSEGEKILASLFGSVTARTAGFNTVDTAALTPASRLLTVILMFIGGSPGSTAGGIKTTTVAIIFIYLLSNLRGMQNIHCFKRRINEEALKKAVTVISVNLTLALAGTLTLCAVQGFDISDAMFEVVSAIGTVGMTTGITPELAPFCQAVIALLMFCGRVGSVSFGLALLERKAKPPVSYPEESITIG